MMTQRVELLAGQRQKGESYRAILACNDYLRMGPRRSLRKLADGRTEMHRNTPSYRLDTLKRWSTRYEWQKRVEEYDAQLDAAKTARAQEIMQSVLALDYERVYELRHVVGS